MNNYEQRRCDRCAMEEAKAILWRTNTYLEWAVRYIARDEARKVQEAKK